MKRPVAASTDIFQMDSRPALICLQSLPCSSWRNARDERHHERASSRDQRERTYEDDFCRFTWLTIAFSKRVENQAHSVALFAMCYNFVRIRDNLGGYWFAAALGKTLVAVGPVPTSWRISSPSLAQA